MPSNSVSDERARSGHRRRFRSRAAAERLESRTLLAAGVEVVNLGTIQGRSILHGGVLRILDFNLQDSYDFKLSVPGSVLVTVTPRPGIGFGFLEMDIRGGGVSIATGQQFGVASLFLPSIGAGSYVINISSEGLGDLPYDLAIDVDQ